MISAKVFSNFIDDIIIEYNDKAIFSFIKDDILSNIEIYDKNNELIDNNLIDIIVTIYNDVPSEEEEIDIKHLGDNQVKNFAFNNEIIINLNYEYEEESDEDEDESDEEDDDGYKHILDKFVCFRDTDLYIIFHAWYDNINTPRLKCAEYPVMAIRSKCKSRSIYPSINTKKKQESIYPSLNKGKKVKKNNSSIYPKIVKSKWKKK
jgi:hypothetical protein